MLLVRRKSTLFLGVLAAGLLAAVVLVPGRADDLVARPDFNAQAGQEKLVKVEVDRTVSRIQTMLTVLRYHQLDTGAQKTLMEEISGSLSGLSRQQITEVIARLESAARTADENSSQKDRDAAYERHREIILTLKALLGKFDAVKTLDQAAQRLEEASKKELELHIKSSNLVQSTADVTSDRLTPKRRLEILRSLKSESEALPDQQHDLAADVGNLFKQLDALKDQLPPDQQQRLKDVKATAAKQNVLDNLNRAADELTANKKTIMRGDNLAKAAATQQQSASDLQQLAQALRSPSDKITALREARDRLDHAITEQDAVKQQSQEARDALKDKDNKDAAEQATQQARDAGDKEARLQHDTADTRSLLQPHAADLASKLAPAEKAMRDAQQALRNVQPEKAEQPQKDAQNAMKDVRNELDKLIAEAEKQKQDPLTAAKNALDTVEKLIQDQKAVREDTSKAELGFQKDKLPEIAPQQKDLNQRTDAAKNETMTADPKTQKALDNASKAMAQATQNLEKKNAPNAIMKQDDAIKALEQAKKELGDAVAEMQKRQDEAQANAAQQLAKAIEQTQQAQADAKQAQDQANKAQNDLNQDKAQPMPGQPMDPTKPADLAQLQKDIADKAAQQGLQEAQKPADAAAQALQKGDLQQAVQQQQKALEKLQQAAGEPMKGEPMPGQPMQGQPMKGEPMKGEPMKGEPMQGQPMKGEPMKGQPMAGQPMQGQPMQGQPQNAAQLAQAQQALLNATQALAQAQQANQAAQAALGQAQAQAPQNVQPQLGQAGQQLGQAGQQLGQGQPTPAQANQAQALQNLNQALQNLNAQLAANGQQQAQPGQSPMAQANAQGQGMGMGMGMGEQGMGMGMGMEQGMGQGMGQPGQPGQPGMGQGQGKQPGQSQERNQAQGEGNRTPDGTVKNSASQLLDVKGDGAFLHLPARQREMIKQALNEKLPPEYSALIQQYYMNLSRGKPAAPPATPQK